MKPYHKISTVYVRDEHTSFKTLILGEYSQRVFAYLAHNEWVFTEKVDGMNVRVLFENKNGLQCSVFFRGKTDNAQLPPFLLESLQQKFHDIETLRALNDIFPNGGCLYGEGYGGNIQKDGNLYSDDPDFVLFDVKVKDWWLRREDVFDVAQKLAIRIVPIIGQGTLPEMINMARTGFVSQWGSFQAEGIVARPSVEFKNRSGGRIITKIKTKDFSPIERLSG